MHDTRDLVEPMRCLAQATRLRSVHCITYFCLFRFEHIDFMMIVLWSH